MSRMTDLEGRRQALLARCEEQRLEVAYRLAQIRPMAQLGSWRHLGGVRPSGRSFAWIAALTGLLLMFRTRRVLTGITWVTGLLALSSRATAVLKVIAQIRALYGAVKAARTPPAHENK
ncbi:MAG TPA: hypothetical protein VMT29_10470 [Steroidobacteraceae bacterium]|nr:hypothetical protein [Steroidobacteraceae bacterium]